MNKTGIYTKKVIDHFKNPRNLGRMKNPDGIGKVGNLVCGDVMWFYIKIGKNKKGEEIIKDVSFETFGCVAAISTTSIVTELTKGKTLKKALKIDRDKVVRSLGGLPPIKYHCSLLAVDALSEAIYDYLSKNKKPILKGLQETHERTEREKKEIEKRYKEWIKIEEKIHKK